MPFHTIDTDEAVTLITAFLNDRTLSTIGINTAIGGVIDLPIPASSNLSGWSFWYCWNLNDNSYPPFFIAYEENDFTAGEPDLTTIRIQTLSTPNPLYIIRYPVNRPTTARDVLDFVTNPTKEWGTVKEPDGTIDSGDVALFTSSFLDDFPDANTANAFNDYAYAYFEQSEVQNFKAQGTYVRYYFGLDTTLAVNQIRLIMVSVDAIGNNQNSPQFSLMQRSWPPDN